MAKRKTPVITLRNHNDTILYKGSCFATAAAEKRLYEYHVQETVTVTIEWI